MSKYLIIAALLAFASEFPSEAKNCGLPSGTTTESVGFGTWREVPSDDCKSVRVWGRASSDNSRPPSDADCKSTGNSDMGGPDDLFYCFIFPISPSETAAKGQSLPRAYLDGGKKLITEEAGGSLGGVGITRYRYTQKANDKVLIEELSAGDIAPEKSAISGVGKVSTALKHQLNPRGGSDKGSVYPNDKKAVKPPSQPAGDSTPTPPSSADPAF